MAATIDYFFTVLSPYSYLGSERLLEISRRLGARIVYRPLRIAPLFAATGGLMLEKRAPQRQAYRLQDLAHLRDFLGIPLNLRPKHWPCDAEPASKMVVAAQALGLDAGPLSSAILRAIWAEERNIADRAVLAEIARACGLDAEALVAASDREDVVRQHEANTEEAIARGVFGVPTYALGDQLFWGQDRLPLLEWAIARG